ncbi:EAL domain-containing protein [Rhodococcus sp. X156]|uniref:putative bifunctional diguanylate cyclase/phosphodiesterase n=1 Tax=Rhodococcus sp. X156 TaxID=2499145 RepID=UPI000FD75164|nr:EAL domain-containing protein [Rhodococcus sp. X156]
MLSGWQWVVILNLVTAAAYLGIAGTILKGLVQTRQLFANRLALATSFIFLSCCLHHGHMALGMLTTGHHSAHHLEAVREVMGGWHGVAIDAFAAAVGIVYLTLRRSYGVLLRSPAMFEMSSEGNYRQLAANLPNTQIYMLDRKQRVLLAAGGGLSGDAAATSLSATQLEGKLVSEVMSGRLLAAYVPYFEAALEGTPADFDFVSDTNGRTYQNHVRPLRDKSETVVGVLFIAEDVTSERAAHQQLQESHAFSEAVLATSPDITLISNLATGELEWASRDAFALVGWSPEQVQAREGLLLRDLLASEDRLRLSSINEAIRDLADGETLTDRFALHGPDGEKHWISRRTTPFGRDASGLPVRALSVIREVTDLVEAEQRLQHAALHDPLTGLPNRTLLLDRITSAVNRADRAGDEVAVLFCDLDGFKRVNDTEGHAAGDVLLIEVAERLRRVLRKGDSVARVGGDEFVVVLEPPEDSQPMRTREVATMLAERIRVDLSEAFVHQGNEHAISVSVGMTFAGRNRAAEEVLRDADAAMYLAKQRGKNRFEVFDDRLRADIIERGRVEQALHTALTTAPGDRPGLSVAFQPMVHLGTGALVSFEALARLTDANGRPVDTNSVIAVAEETGLISGLGERVLGLALDGLVQWRRDHPEHAAATVSVNLSGRQARDADMPRLICAALEERNLQPTDLTLELTETVLLEAGSSTLRQLAELRKLGVGIAIDDFGIGYASLRHLAMLPVSAVKVDRSFTAGMGTDDTSATIVLAITTLAANLGLDCVVEGIETAEQLAALPTTVHGQGYLWGRPAPSPQHPATLDTVRATRP